MLIVANVAMVRNFVVISIKFNFVRICASGNYA
jgi:hypothetical protein